MHDDDDDDDDYNDNVLRLPYMTLTAIMSALTAVLNITIKLFFFEATCSKIKSSEARLTLFWPFLMHNWRTVNLI